MSFDGIQAETCANPASSFTNWVPVGAPHPFMYQCQNPHYPQYANMVPGWQPAFFPEALVPAPPMIAGPPVSHWPGALALSPRESPPQMWDVMNSAWVTDYASYPSTYLWNQFQVLHQIEHVEPDNGKYNSISGSPKRPDREPHPDMVPKKYQKVIIKYPKFGLEDFDFKYYNKTLFASLDPNIPNAYCNCMIQVLYFLEPLRCSLQNHSCQREFCLACELGFLFHMLDLSRGESCQASNFLRAFRMMPDVSALGLKLADSDEQTGMARLGDLIQSWNCFILTQLQKENQGQEGEPVIERLFGCEVEKSSVCYCGKETIQSSLTLLFNLQYPQQNSQEEAPKEYDFAEILKKSICLEKSTRAWCDGCNKYRRTVQTRHVRRLPDVLAVNCEVNSDKEAEFWKVQAEYAFNKAMQEEATKPTKTTKPTTAPREWYADGEEFCSMEDITVDTQAKDLKNVWIPATLKISISKTTGLEISSWPDGKELSAAEEAEGASLYDLVVTVPHILDPCTSGHLVAHIKVGETYHKRKEGVTHQQWYLFNDVLIEPIDKAEAAQFDVTWKVPAILYYAKRNYHTKYDLRIKNPIDARVLQTEAPLTWSWHKNKATFSPLKAYELPRAGDLVGLEAEFLKLKEEVVELLSDGTKSTIKPSQMSVARITCVRGQGNRTGLPFIDDYISTQEQVVDYLTEYSGIEPEDLDVRTSSKHLTTLKSTYLKLRFLVDAGVRFVGHGLQNHFHHINLLVPKDQIIDTVQLFRLPSRRMISRRFLAWYFFEHKVHNKTHDSLKHPDTALMLYRKYQELSRGGENEVQEVLKKLYEKGQQVNWKI